MSPSLERFLALLAAVSFTTNALAPGLLHGCEEGVGASAQAMGHTRMADAQHHCAGQHDHGKQRAPGHSHGCQCVGHSCCCVAVALSGSVRFPAAATVPVGPGLGVVVLRTPVTRAHHMLPLAQAPPLPA